MGFLLQAAVFRFVGHSIGKVDILCDVLQPLSQLFESHDRRPKFDSVPHPENDDVYVDFLPLTWRYVDCRDCLQQSCIETFNFTMNIPFIHTTQPKLQIIKQHTLTRPYLI